MSILFYKSVELPIKLADRENEEHMRDIRENNIKLIYLSTDYVYPGVDGNY